MKRKKKAVLFLAVLFAVSLCLAGVGGSAEAANTKNVRYYYSQLSGDAKPIYDAMFEMYEQGIFKTGTERYGLVENGHLTKEKLASYEGKYDGLLKSFGAARDAFYADYPDIFYVDFSALAVTVEGNSADGYTAYLGAAGEKDTYYTEGFTGREQVESAIKEQDARVNGIVTEAKKAAAVKEQVIAAHNAVIKGTAYKLEHNCSAGNKGHIRTSYGALVKGESLCEGYARGLKSVLDSLGVESVLVQGYYKDTDGSKNLHMWNYVKLDGKWYAIDATANDGMSGSIAADTYLLAEGPVMKEHHIPDGVMSPGGVRFTYPALEGGSGSSSELGETDSDGYKVVFDKDGLRVGYKDGVQDGREAGIFKVSYNGMGYEEAARKEGIYILSRFYQYMPGTGEDEQGRWGYSDPKPFVMPQLKDALILANGNSRYIEFAVTKVAPEGPLYGDNLTAEELEKNWNFQGTEKDLIVSTGKLENPKGNFVPSPWAKSLTPGSTGFLLMGNTYSVTAVFNEDLEEYDGKKAGYKLTVEDGASALDHCKVEEFKWDGRRTVTFQFTPSTMWADNYARYDFQVTGLRGKGSWKAPDVFSYYVKKTVSICAFRPQGYYFNVFAKPELLEPGDLSCKGWVLDSGKKLEEEVSNVTIVASKPVLRVSDPSGAEEKEMLEKIVAEGDTVLQSATYNIDLLMCNKSVVGTGSSIRMSVGFPAGYGADSEGVTYKAYHFIKDKSGKITDVEEIPCVVTQYGLVIACKSFSPYAVAAVKNNGIVAAEKKVLLLNSAGGEIAGEDRICRLEKDKSRTVTLKAKDGYSIDSINLSGKQIPVTNPASMSVKLSYSDLEYDENIMEVTFVEKKQESQAAQGSSSSNGSGSSSGSSGSSSGNSGGSGSSKSSDKKQENNQAPAASGAPAAGQAAAPFAAAQTPGAQAAPQKNQTPVTPSGNGGKKESAVRQETEKGIETEYDAMASAEENGGEDAEKPEQKSNPVSQAVKELEGEETAGDYESAEEGEDRGFWIILASILGAGALGMGGIAVAHARRKL